ncbi:solute carrier family 22 member 7-like [Anticarsia gemmatalis]|uniref:solute carrier family 22 member 7-like n=1 Tax=Anticarsia gemmatalis TaxID=129554 RepID=UPI003F76CDFF
MVPTLFNHYEDMFLLHSSEVFCTSPSETENSSLCFVTLKNETKTECTNWHFKLLWLIWLKKTWLVFCDDKLKLLSTAIISRFGLVFGCIIFGLVSDSFGRRTAIILDVFAELVFGLVITFCDSEGWFRLIAFLKSLFGSANFYMGIILVCEIASNKWRSWLCVLVMSPRLLRMICMVPLANSAPNPETYSFIACIYCCFCFISLRWSPESPQWLLFNRKIAVAEKILLRAAKTNGITLCSTFKIRPINCRAYNSLDETTTCIGVMSTYNIRMLFFVATIFWALYYFLWSSLYVRMYSEENSQYLLIKVFCFIVMFTCLTIVSSLKLTLRYLLLAHILLTGTFSAGIKLFRKGTIHSFFASVALASGLVAHALILNITPRLFAINIRATFFGCCHATGQLGSIISYLLFLFCPTSEITLMAVELAVTAVLAGLCFIIPNVDERELPDIVKDMDYFSELSKPVRWVTQKTNSPSREEVEMRVYSFGSTQRSVSYNHSDERLPARRIGCIRIWHVLINCIRKKLGMKIATNTS